MRSRDGILDIAEDDVYKGFLMMWEIPFQVLRDRSRGCRGDAQQGAAWRVTVSFLLVFYNFLP